MGTSRHNETLNDCKCRSRKIETKTMRISHDPNTKCNLLIACRPGKYVGQHLSKRSTRPARHSVNCFNNIYREFKVYLLGVVPRVKAKRLIGFLWIHWATCDGGRQADCLIF